MGIILVYSVTSRRSFECLARILDDLRAVIDSSCCILLVANASLLQIEIQRAVSGEEGLKFAQSHKLHLFREVEGKSDLSINEALVQLTDLIKYQDT